LTANDDGPFSGERTPLVGWGTALICIFMTKGEIKLTLKTACTCGYTFHNIDIQLNR